MNKTHIFMFIFGMLVGLSVFSMYYKKVKIYSFNSVCQQIGYDYYNGYIGTQGVCAKEIGNNKIEIFELFLAEKIEEGIYKGYYK